VSNTRLQPKTLPVLFLIIIITNKQTTTTTTTKKPRKLKFWKKGRIAKNQKVTAGWLFFVSVTKYELSERFQPSRTRLF